MCEIDDERESFEKVSSKDDLFVVVVYLGGFILSSSLYTLWLLSVT